VLIFYIGAQMNIESLGKIEFITLKGMSLARVPFRYSYASSKKEHVQRDKVSFIFLVLDIF